METYKSIREGHRRIIRQYLQRIEAAKEEPTPTIFNTILNNIQKKQEFVRESDQKIIELLQPEEIETEMIEADEYHLNLEIQINMFKEYRRSEGFVSETDIMRPEQTLPVFPAIQTSQQTKFNYLKAQLEGPAANTIAGFALTNANYERAVSLLHERFGQVHKIIQAYMQALLEQPRPVNTLPSLQSYYDQLESYIRGLESIGQFQETYGSLLIPVIISKLPAEVRKNLTREHGNVGWTLAELRKAIYKEITVMDAGQSVIPEVHDNPRVTASFYTGSRGKQRPPRSLDMRNPAATEKKACVFCSEQHSPIDCTKVTTYQSRTDIVKNKQLCFNCLGSHQVSKCRSNFRCRRCQRKHHTSICDRKSAQPTAPTVPTAPTTSDQQRNQQATAILHSSTQSPSNVLLKTAIAPVCNQQFRVDATILFDEGAQRSFITEKLADELHLPRGNPEIIHLTSFGDSNQNVRFMDTSTVYLVTDSGRKIAIQVLVVPTIAVPLRNLQRDVKDLPYLRGLKLAHPITDDESYEISLLIGADHYWKIVQNRIVRGNGPTAVSSKIGYLLSGPLPSSPTNTPTTYIMNVLTSPPDVHELERFWKLESMGITPEEDPSSTEYLQTYQTTAIKFEDGRYSAMLPWKLDHPPLPSNYFITKRRTEKTIHRLRQEPHLLNKYGEIIKEQVRRDFIEKVPDSEIASKMSIIFPP
ncbi:uncharacterized protein LOC123533118 [Mercenaria mercenaria]|uniref:uncharacterized protein LOC123533118 n=1 Tax=Mercenaria mercenaria TaxID=6596 RepID=UPI00234F95FA|nr:uncharacterized protein LOC123533118 [Mercenaria mercenaria]